MQKQFDFGYIDLNNVSMTTNAILFEGIDPVAQEIFDQQGIHVTSYKQSFQSGELSDKLKYQHIAGIRSNTKLTQDVIAASMLDVVGCYCIGTNQVDLNAASAYGVAVFNDPVSNGRSVVELALGMIFSLARKLPEKNSQMHEGIWNKSAAGAIEMRGKTIGIVGYGNIGKQLGQACSMLGMNVVYFDKVAQQKNPYANPVSLDELFEISDVVSLHVPGEGTSNLIGTEQLAKMKKSAYLLNLSRGHVVDQQAVADALESGNLAGAGFDVYASEPKENGPGFVNSLVGKNNVILTPHIGGSTAEAQKAIAEYTSRKIVQYLQTGNTVGSVNMPQIELGQVEKEMTRIGIIHPNTKGMIDSFTDELKLRDINIEEMGNKNRIVGSNSFAYTYFDVAERDFSQELLGSLRGVEGVIKVKKFG